MAAEKQKPERMLAGRTDLAVVILEVIDRTWHAVPDATVPVSFSINSTGELAEAGTANPKDVRSFRRPNPATYHGKSLAIVRPTGKAGTVTLRAKAEGLEPANIVLEGG